MCLVHCTLLTGVSIAQSSGALNPGRSIFIPKAEAQILAHSTRAAAPLKARRHQPAGDKQAHLSVAVGSTVKVFAQGALFYIRNAGYSDNKASMGDMKEKKHTRYLLPG